MKPVSVKVIQDQSNSSIRVSYVHEDGTELTEQQVRDIINEHYDLLAKQAECGKTGHVNCDENGGLYDFCSKCGAKL